MSAARETIPTVETYRGIGIHDYQPPGRIEAVVKPEIDRVYGMSNPRELSAYAIEARNPPEARPFAAARCEAAWQMAAHARELRPAVDMTTMRAFVAGLDSLTWIDSWHYGTLLDPTRTAPARDPDQTARLRAERGNQAGPTG